VSSIVLATSSPKSEFADLVVARYIQWEWDDVWCGEHREGYRSYCHSDYFKPISMLVYHNDGN
jgi:hypothetical protein